MLAPGHCLAEPAKNRFRMTSAYKGRVLFSVLGAVASFEHDLINDRTEEGKVRARAKGVRFGRTPKLKSEQLADMHARFAAGVSRAVLAQEFKITRSSVYRLCQHLTQPPQETKTAARKKRT